MSVVLESFASLNNLGLAILVGLLGSLGSIDGPPHAQPHVHRSLKDEKKSVWCRAFKKKKKKRKKTYQGLETEGTPCFLP
ncbi:unnamed protein product [Prunus armeniaca]